MHPFLVTHHLFSGIDERNTLRSQHCRLRQFVKSYELFGCDAGDTRLQAIYQAHIIVAGYVTDHLSRLGSPGSFTVIHRIIVDLRVTDSSYNTKLNALFFPGDPGKERSLMIIIKRTTQRITNFIGKGGNTRHFTGIDLHCQRITRILRCFRCPTFTINNDRRIYSTDRLTDFIHRLDVVNAHQVETETIDMVFPDPVKHGFNHIFTHHRPVACRLVTTSRTIGQRTIRLLAIKISRYRTFEVTAIGVVCMIVYHIEHYPYTSFVQCLYHLLKLADADSRIVRIGSIRTIGYIVILRIISPVVFIFIQLGFVYRSIIIRRKQMDVCYSQLDQMIDSGQQFGRVHRTMFCQCQKFSLMLNP